LGFTSSFVPISSPVSIKPAKGDTVKELRKIMENLHLEESSGLTDIIVSRKIDNILEKNFTTSCGYTSSPPYKNFVPKLQELGT
jgi:hypothetical protein